MSNNLFGNTTCVTPNAGRIKRHASVEALGWRMPYTRNRSRPSHFFWSALTVASGWLAAARHPGLGLHLPTCSFRLDEEPFCPSVYHRYQLTTT